MLENKGENVMQGKICLPEWNKNILTIQWRLQENFRTEVDQNNQRHRAKFKDDVYAW